MYHLPLLKRIGLSVVSNLHRAEQAAINSAGKLLFFRSSSLANPMSPPRRRRVDILALGASDGGKVGFAL